MIRRAILEPGRSYLQPEIDVYNEGYDSGRAGSLSIPDKYRNAPVIIQDAHAQGWFDAQAGREKNINQDRTQPED